MVSSMFILAEVLNLMIIVMYVGVNGYAFKHVKLSRKEITLGIISIAVPLATVYWLNLVERMIHSSVDYNQVHGIREILSNGGVWENIDKEIYLRYKNDYYALASNEELRGASLKVLDYMLNIKDERMIE